MNVDSPYLELLKDRLNLEKVPFTERGSRLLIFQSGQHLMMRLAEGWFKSEAEPSAHRLRLPLIDEFRFTDGQGRPLEFQTTTYPHRVNCETAIGTFTLTFVDTETLLIALPSALCGMNFRAYLDRAQTDRRGGILRLTSPVQRTVAYTINAPLLTNEIESPEAATQSIHLTCDASAGGRALMINITPRLGFNRSVPNPAVVLQEAAQRWHAWFDAAPAVPETYRTQYYYAWWVMRAGLISTRFYTTREAMTPSKGHYEGVWQWDAYFHALAYRHVDMRLAKDQIRIVLDHQRADGMIPDAVHDEGLVTHLLHPIEADVTKPPLLAWAAWKLYETDGDSEFLNEIYELITRCNHWWFEKNDLNGNGLCEYQHPYSSGLDDSPLWDGGMPVESPDLNTYLYLQEEALAKIAAVIGESQAAKSWAERSAAMVQRLIQGMWDDQAGLFWASRWGQRINVRTPFNLFPLITGQMPLDIVARLVNHLTDENQFWPPYPVPTVALDDPTYAAQTMWRGPVWVNVNYLLIEGLERSGQSGVARHLRQRTLAMMNKANDIYEYYQSQTGEAPPTAVSVFGWSSALFIEMVLQETKLENEPGLTDESHYKGSLQAI